MSDKEFYRSHDAGGEWGTPTDIVRPLIAALDQDLFDVDPASGAEPEPYADTRYTVEDNGLRKSWFGHVWLNPPYGEEVNGKWAEKAYRESQRDEVDSITALVPNYGGVSWFKQYYAKCDFKVEIQGKVQFVGPDDHGPSFYNAIVVFGADNLPSRYIDELRKQGTTWVRPDDTPEVISAAEVDW
jgi:hypothetical protein